MIVGISKWEGKFERTQREGHATVVTGSVEEVQMGKPG